MTHLLPDLVLWPSAEATAVVILVLGSQHLLRSHLPAAWRHGLWSLVFLRLLLPSLPASPWSLFQLTSDYSPMAALPALSAPVPITTGVAAQPAQEISPMAWVVGLWTVSFLILAGRRLWASRGLRLALRRGRTLREGRVASIFATCQGTLRSSGRVKLIEAAGLGGPVACGVLRPRVVLPPGFGQGLSDEEIHHVLLHELAHLHRRDPLSLQLAGWLAAIHWFNPLLHWAVRRFADDCELACDAAVLRQLEHAERPRYGQTLLRLSTQNPLPASALGISSKQTLERRIQMISNYLPPSPKRAFLAADVLAILAVFSLTDALPAAGSGSASNSEPELSELEQDRLKQAQTIADLRTTGRVMLTWLTTHQPAGKLTAPDEEEETTTDWNACPSISYQALQSLLVPNSLPELPRSDPWGNDYQFCLDTRFASNRSVAGIRATGKDGKFSGHRYTISAFTPDEFHRDVIWTDGYFMTWPGPPQ